MHSRMLSTARATQVLRYLIDHHIVPAFGNRPVSTFTSPEEIVAWEKRTRTRGFSHRTAADARSLLGTILGDAKERGMVASNVAVSAPDARRVISRLRNLDFLVVSDFFLSETAALADVVFPSAQWAEEEGTMTNLEGRVIRRRRAFAPPSGVWTDLQILAGLSAGLGRADRFPTADPRELFEELRWASAGAAADYAGITYERIEREGGVFWPCPTEEHPGTPRLFADGFPTPTGRARFHPVRYEPPAEATDAEFPLVLTTGRLLAHYQSGTQTRRVGPLLGIADRPEAEVSPAVARSLGVRSGEQIMVRTRRGSAAFPVRVDAGIREDTVFLPFHWGGEQGANRLTNPALDPISRMPEFKVCAVRLERYSSNGEGS